MSHASESRRQRRALKRAGVALLDRVVIDSGALSKAVVEGVDLVDLVAYHVSQSLERLHAQGGDVLAHTVVTIGDHPDYPGGVTIEAKVERKRPVAGSRLAAILADDDDESAGGLLAEL